MDLARMVQALCAVTVFVRPAKLAIVVLPTAMGRRKATLTVDTAALEGPLVLVMTVDALWVAILAAKQTV
jgi:hypothetical protein